MSLPLLAHQKDPTATIRVGGVENPLRVLVSGCVAGEPCGTDGTDYGLGNCLGDLLKLKSLKVFSFCPEAAGIGVPRNMPDIHGGDGFAVLDGKAQVLDEHDNNLTEQIVNGCRAMLEFAKQSQIELAILTDMSAACGSQVISKGCRLVKKREFLASVGIATALLLREGIPVVSQRDFQTLALLRQHLCPKESIRLGLLDHHRTEWFENYFLQVSGG